MLEYTGHPLVDVGVATITAFAGKEHPAALTTADLEAVADYITREYVKQPLKSFLTVAFTSNAWFIQDAYNPDKPNLSKEKRQKRQQERKKWATHHLKQWAVKSGDEPGQWGIFTGKPAVSVKLSKKLPPGRAGRAQIPLLLGDDSINFHPYGQAGLPVSGEALLAIQAFPLGTAKCGGRLLAVHSNNEELMLHFARRFLEQNRQAIQLAQQAGSKKMPEPRYAYRTLLIDTLLEARIMQRDAEEDELPVSVTAYYLSNSGQGVDLKLYHLPLQMVAFLGDMQQARYAQEWQKIVHRAWEVAPKKKKKSKKTEPFKPRRNWLYEDLFTLPDSATRFIRTYFLRMALQYAKRSQTDPRANYSTQAEVELISWPITARFLWRILHMDKARIEHIKQLGDTLAEYIQGQNDRRFLWEFFTARRYHHLRNSLIKANLAHTRRGQPPLITFDTYISVFEEGEELARSDWTLARDLVLIRMVERLHKLGWLGQNPDAIPETEAETETNSESSD